MNVNEIKELVELLNDSSISELKIENKDFKISIRTKHFHNGKVQQVVSQAIPMAQPLPTANLMPPAIQTNNANAGEQVAKETAATDSAMKDDSKYVIFRSPMIGTFYRSSAPDKPPYVKIGDAVKKNQVVCIIEAMKLFNEIEIEMDGKIVEILVEDRSPVEYDQALFKIELDA
ncbi:MAG: acetyl-CoA carboxylase biotin carboxyl carrier protein [Chitinophagales bacterium]